MTSSGPKGLALSHLGITLQNPAFDESIGQSILLVDRMRTMKFQPSRVSIVRLRYRSTKSFMAKKGVKDAIPERAVY